MPFPVRCGVHRPEFNYEPFAAARLADCPPSDREGAGGEAEAAARCRNTIIADGAVVAGGNAARKLDQSVRGARWRQLHEQHKGKNEIRAGPGPCSAANRRSNLLGPFRSATPEFCVAAVRAHSHSPTGHLAEGCRVDPTRLTFEGIVFAAEKRLEEVSAAAAARQMTRETHN